MKSDEQISSLGEICASNLRQLRKSLKLNQQEMADRLEINRVTLSNIERGKLEMRLSLVDKVCNEFGLDCKNYIFKKLTIKTVQTYEFK